jgi:hypothetical protein
MAVLFHTRDLPKTLRASRKKLVLLLFVTLVFVAIGIVEIRSEEASLGGWLCALLFGLGAVVFALNLLPGASYLRLEREGFTFCTLFRRTHMQWARIATFSVHRIPTKSMVGWSYVPGFDLGSAAMRSMNQKLAGCDAALPDTYGCNANDLAETLTALHAELVAKKQLAPDAPMPGQVDEAS